MLSACSGDPPALPEEASSSSCRRRRCRSCSDSPSASAFSRHLSTACCAMLRPAFALPFNPLAAPGLPEAESPSGNPLPVLVLGSPK